MERSQIFAVSKKAFASPNVIAVNDELTDDTAYVAQAAGAIVARHEKNQGKGDALNTGFCQAHQLEPEAIVIIDGDGQVLPEQLPRLVRPALACKFAYNFL